ncbi:MAG: HIT family protein [Chitinophagales bacterium]|nr:HIT family protein [Chitinophagales bacterium]
MASIFTRIINGDIPCYKIYEDENYFAFLDISPLAKGHALVVPKQEVDYIFDLSDETYQGLMQVSKKIAIAIQTAVPCKRIGIAVVGLEVPHAHVHLIPLHSGAINFNDPKLQLPKEELIAIASAIVERLR